MKIFQMARKHCVVFFTGIVFAVLCFLGLNAAMVPVSKSAFCGSKCHEMNTAYLSWELSVHGSNKFGIRVECIDCHLPPKDKYFRHLAAKAYEGGKDAYKHYFGGEYDVEKLRKQVLANIPNQRCMSCHDDLLNGPDSSAARAAHQPLLNDPESSEHRCVQCHENIGHERQEAISIN